MYSFFAIPSLTRKISNVMFFNRLCFVERKQVFFSLPDSHCFHSTKVVRYKFQQLTGKGNQIYMWNVYVFCKFWRGDEFEPKSFHLATVLNHTSNNDQWKL